MKKLSLAILAALAATSHAVLYEAEDQSGVEASQIVNSAEHSGGKYVSLSNSTMTFSVEVEETGMYDIEAKVRIHQYDWTTSKIVVNGVEAGSQLTTPRNNDSDYVVTTSAKLRTGQVNEITVGNGAIGVDYISVNRHPSAEFNIGKAPVSDGANEAAYKLKTFLVENFGKKTVSGMMIGDNAFNYHYGATLEDSYLIETCVPSDSCKYADSLTTWKGQEDIREFKSRSGYYPALGGFDFLFATGGHSDEGWFSGYTDNNIRMARELWKAGGIPAFTWHWKVGTDTVFYTKESGYKNNSCKNDTLGTASDNTCFNFTKAFTDSTCATVNAASDEYKLLMADVDKVSKRLLSLQDSGVAVIWRPLHEAAGGWFWWGIAGADCYKALYRIVFDRMVNLNGVKNALWTWNIERDPSIGYDVSALNAKWYPGDDVVDIVGVDIYNNSGDHKSNATYFNKIVSDVGTKKLIALTENGPIPDVDSTFEDEAVWSFWMPWYNTWSSGFLNQTSNDVWQKNLADDRIIKLETMPGWKNVIASIRPTAKAKVQGIAVQGKTLSLSLGDRAKASVYTLQGKFVQSLCQNISAGSYTFDLSPLPQGVYLVRVQDSKRSYSQKIILR